MFHISDHIPYQIKRFEKTIQKIEHFVDIAREKWTNRDVVMRFPQIHLADMHQCSLKRCRIEQVDVFGIEPNQAWAIALPPEFKDDKRVIRFAAYVCLETNIWHVCDDIVYGNRYNCFFEVNGSCFLDPERGYMCPMSGRVISKQYCHEYNPNNPEAHLYDTFGNITSYGAVIQACDETHHLNMQLVNMKEKEQEENEYYEHRAKKLKRIHVTAQIPLCNIVNMPDPSIPLTDHTVAQARQMISTSPWHGGLTLHDVDDWNCSNFSILYFQARIIVFQMLFSSYRIHREQEKYRTGDEKIKNKMKEMERQAREARMTLQFVDVLAMIDEYEVELPMRYFKTVPHMTNTHVQNRIVAYYALRAIQIWKNVVFHTERGQQERTNNRLAPRESFIASLYIMRTGFIMDERDVFELNRSKERVEQIVTNIVTKKHELVIIPRDEFLTIFLPEQVLVSSFEPVIRERGITQAIHTLRTAMTEALTISAATHKISYSDLQLPAIKFDRIISLKEEPVEKMMKELVNKYD